MRRLSLEVQNIQIEAHRLSQEVGHALTSLHLLLAIFSEETRPNQAYSVLHEEGVQLEELLARLRKRPRERETAVKSILDRCQDMAKITNSSIVNSLHLLLAMTRVSDSVACKILRKHHEDLNGFRSEIFDKIKVSPVAARPRRDPTGPDREARAPRDPRAQVPEVIDVPMPEEPGARAEARHDEARQDEVRAERRVAELSVEPRAGRPISREDAAEFRREFLPRSRFELDPAVYPCLTELGRNLCLEAEQGKLDPLIGRGKEVADLNLVLSKRRTNNPCLIGPPGVGKTAIAEGLACGIAQGDYPERIIVELNAGKLVAGTHFRGSFAERLKGIREEVARADGKVIIFADEIHTLLKTGSGDSGVDVGNDLKGALSRGEFPCIGATTDEEYRQHIAADQALDRRFQAIHVEEPTPAEALGILKGIRSFYEGHHKVSYSDDVLEAVVNVARRYVTDKALPDSAINLMDSAGAACRAASSRAEDQVSEVHVARMLASYLRVPEEQVIVNQRERLLGMVDELATRVVGHQDNLRRISAAVQRSYAGFGGGRPTAAFLFAGPVGVGKRATARALAEFMFGSEESFTHLQMGEFSDPQDVTKLVGAAPSYIGHEQGSLLERVMMKHPCQLLVFDEIDKAHPKVQQIITQIIDTGVVTDNRGRRLDFTNTILALVASVSDGGAMRRMRGVGFSRQEQPETEAWLEPVKARLNPELWHALDEKLVFTPLSADEVDEVLRRSIQRVRADIKALKGLSIRVTEAFVASLLERASVRDGRVGADLGLMTRRVIEASVSGWILRSGRTGEADIVLDHDGQQVTTAEEDADDQER
jgi:ATP-dependent Clp protease ATP-binding subunit ClpC